MGLFEFIMLVALVGFLVWLFTSYVPMDNKFKSLIIWGAVIVLVFVLIRSLGLLNYDVPLRIR
jgi:hypothetical protein